MTDQDRKAWGKHFVTWLVLALLFLSFVMIVQADSPQPIEAVPPAQPTWQFYGTGNTSYRGCVWCGRAWVHYGCGRSGTWTDLGGVGPVPCSRCGGRI